MRRHIGVVAGSVIAVLGFVLAIAAFSGFSAGLPAVQPASALGASWFMVAVVLLFGGSFAALLARGVQLVDEERTRVDVPQGTPRLHAVR